MLLTVKLFCRPIRREALGADVRFPINLIMCALIVASGCTDTTQTPTLAPNGQIVQTTKCSQSPSACYSKAAAACSGPYRVVDSYSKAGGIAADILPGPVPWYYMTYSCGRSDGKMPQFPLRGPDYVAPVFVYNTSAPTTTTCNGYGNSVTCTSR